MTERDRVVVREGRSAPLVPLERDELWRVLEAVQLLPDDATVEDAIERLCFISKVQKGLSELDAGQGRTHEEARRQIVGD